MLTEILRELLSLDSEEDKPLRKGLILCWRPPMTLRLTRRGSVEPSEQERETVEKCLEQLGYMRVSTPLLQIANKDGVIFYYYEITLVRQLVLA